MLDVLLNHFSCFGISRRISIEHATYRISCFSLPSATAVSSHDTLESGLEPLDGIILDHLVLFANLALASPSPRHVLPVDSLHHASALKKLKYTSAESNSHAAVKVHSVDTNARVILDAQIDVFGDAKTKVPGI